MKQTQPGLLLILIFVPLAFLSCSDRAGKKNISLPANQVFLERSKDNNPEEFVGVPVTECYVALNTVQSERIFWPRESLQYSEWSTFFIEMDPVKVPDGPWNDYTNGMFEIAILLKTKDLTNVDVNFDSLPGNSYFLLNNYHGPDRDDKISGQLHLSKKDSIFVVSGLIRVVTKDPVAVQVIRFSSAKIPAYDSNGLNNHFAQEEKKQKEKEESVSALFDSLSIFERRFYEDISKNYPANNQLVAKGSFAKEDFNCELAYSLIVEGARPTAADIKKLEKGDYYVFRIPYLYDPRPMATDDETSIFILIQLKTLNRHETQRAGKDFTCKININGWGVNMDSPPEVNYEGELMIDEIRNGLAKGSLDLSFSQEGNNYFKIKGNFVVRVINFNEWDNFDREGEKIYDKIEQIEKKHF